MLQVLVLLKHRVLLAFLDRTTERRCWNRADVGREALREKLHSGKDTRPGNASGAEAWIVWGSWDCHRTGIGTKAAHLPKKPA